MAPRGRADATSLASARQRTAHVTEIVPLRLIATLGFARVAPGAVACGRPPSMTGAPASTGTGAGAGAGVPAGGVLGRIPNTSSWPTLTSKRPLQGTSHAPSCGAIGVIFT